MKVCKRIVQVIIIMMILIAGLVNLYMPISYADAEIGELNGVILITPLNVTNNNIIDYTNDTNTTDTNTTVTEDTTKEETTTTKPVKLATQKGYVKVRSTVTLRKKASTSSKKVTTLKAGQQLYILSTKKSGWYKVKTSKNKVGYIQKKYVGTKTNKKYKLLTTYTTYSNTSPANRNYNMNRAGQKLTKITLKAGETFSWFKSVGPCGKAQGYKVASVIVNGKFVPGYGGGVCQVATTLYGCSKKLKMKTVERHSHSSKVYYINKDGYESAVSYGSKNLRFKNTTKKNIIFDVYAANGRVIVAAYQVL